MTTTHVFHRTEDRLTGAVTFARVARVERPVTDDMTACEDAWSLTQNIRGSWSRPGNPDSNEAVTVLGKLPVVDGRTLGLRSSDVRDVVCVDGARWYVVASCGFEPCEPLLSVNVWPKGYADSAGPAEVIYPTGAPKFSAVIAATGSRMFTVMNEGPACYPPVPEVDEAYARAMTKGDNT